MRLSNPSAEALVRQDLIDGISQFLDKRLLDPVYAGVTSVSPPSLTYGVTPRAASGSTLAAIDDDVGYLMAQFANNELTLTTGVWVMSSQLAITLSLLRAYRQTDDAARKEEFRKALLLSINCVAAGFGATG